jgi:hypothetical protein
MRKWKCVKSNSIYFTIGRIYETDENGDGLTDDSSSNRSWTNPWRFKLGGFNGASFEEVFNKVKKEDKKVTKFKVGDKVRILDGSKIKDYTGGFVYEMKQNIGKLATIASIEMRGERYCYFLVEYGCIYDERGLELANKLNKSLTITTSDSTTTLTDGTHTTTINRYYTDKHDERVAIDYVVKKYYDELNEIDRVSKTPKVGDKVKVVDKELTYDTYKQWLVKNNISIESALKWSNGELPRNGVIFEIIMIVENHVLIENDRECFIIDIKGIEVIK